VGSIPKKEKRKKDLEKAEKTDVHCFPKNGKKKKNMVYGG